MNNEQRGKKNENEKINWNKEEGNGKRVWFEKCKD